jgi:hypothetical protein
MNTKILMQRLAKAATSKAKASFALIKMNSDTLRSIELGLVTSVLFVSASVIEIKALLSLVSADVF